MSLDAKLREILREFGYQDEFHQADDESIDQALQSIKALILEEKTTRSCQTCEGRGYNWKNIESYRRNEKPDYLCPSCKGTGMAKLEEGEKDEIN